ncbi:MAG: murein biosynthesis integral membrane protein MurJ [Devosiaceae bacterium]|nr:murein biosynthesis integral membrane protein MurJ [Devosiaceae bacterium]
MTLLSRILGFVRDILIANVLGTSMAANAFFAAFRFPNLFRRLFAEGAFNAALIPLFTGTLEREGEHAARDLAARIISWLVLFLFVLTVVAEIFMPQIMAVFVPGFLLDPVKFEFTVLLARICFPYLALMSVMAAFGGMLNGLGKFLAAAFAPVMLNIVMIAILVFLVFSTFGQVDGAIWLSGGVILGGVAQVGIVIWALRNMGLLPVLKWPAWDKDVARFWKLALPAVLAGGVTQINIFVGTIIASGATSAISYLYFADRLYQLPLGIIGVAIGVVLLPQLSRHLKGKRFEQAALAQEQSLFLAMMLGLPAAAALFVLSREIVQVLFERGAFDAAATNATAPALGAFALGLPAFVLIKVFQPGFFAREDTVTPTILAAMSVVINIALSLYLFADFSHIGIAIATSVAAWFNAVFLIAILMKRGHFSMGSKVWKTHIFIVVSSLAMAGLLWFGSIFGGHWINLSAMPLVQIFSFSALLLIGMVFYFLLLQLFGVVRLNELKKMLSKSV